MATSSVGAVGGQSQSEATQKSLAGAIDSETFLELLLHELQNQDPLEPMSNSELVQQLSQIWELQSNMELAGTLESVRLSQNVAAASSMIGRLVAGMTDDGEQVAGRVDGVSISDGKPKLYVGQYMIDLENVSDIVDESAGA
jgi:flagellar basal-body rod modification protein FlgD